jgi:hypothetical protein
MPQDYTIYDYTSKNTDKKNGKILKQLFLNLIVLELF